MVVCKKCGTEWKFGEKRKMSMEEKVKYWFVIIIAIVLYSLASWYNISFFAIPHSSQFFFDTPSTILGVLFYCCLYFIIMFRNVYNCPACGSLLQCIPADSPLGKKLKKKK